MKMRILFAVSMAAVSVMLLWALPAAQASETIYWSNFERQDALAFANLDGTEAVKFDSAGPAGKRIGRPGDRLGQRAGSTGRTYGGGPTRQRRHLPRGSRRWRRWAD